MELVDGRNGEVVTMIYAGEGESAAELDAELAPPDGSASITGVRVGNGEGERDRHGVHTATIHGTPRSNPRSAP